MTRYFKATNVVLGLLCVMYFVTYIDRVNVSTAASAIHLTAASFMMENLGLTTGALLFFYGMKINLSCWPWTLPPSDKPPSRRLPGPR